MIPAINLQIWNFYNFLPSLPLETRRSSKGPSLAPLWREALHAVLALLRIGPPQVSSPDGGKMWETPQFSTGSWSFSLGFPWIFIVSPVLKITDATDRRLSAGESSDMNWHHTMAVEAQHNLVFYPFLGNFTGPNCLTLGIESVMANESVKSLGTPPFFWGLMCQQTTESIEHGI